MTVIGSMQPAEAESGPNDAGPVRDESDNPDLCLTPQSSLFSKFPGPVMFVDKSGAVSFANAAASLLEGKWLAGNTVELAEAVASAQAGHVAQVVPLILGAGPEDGQAGQGDSGQVFDLIVLPWEQGGAALFGRDISLERGLRSALIDSRQRYKDLVEASSDFAWETDREGCFTFITPQGALGYSAGELVGASAASLLIDAEGFRQSPFMAEVIINQVEAWVRDVDGQAVCLAVSALPLLGPEGAWSGVRGTCRDVTAERLREAEQARGAHRQSLLAYLLRMTREQAEPARMLEAVARSLLPALSLAGAEIFCRNEAGDLITITQAGDPAPGPGFAPLIERLDASADAAPLDSHEAGRKLLVLPTAYQGRGNGALALWWPEEAQDRGQEDQILLEEVVAQIGVANRQVQREDRLEKLSATDPLTGLENRRGFVANVDRLLKQRDVKIPAALFYIDLDNFKQINDTLGHQAGDKALQAVAELLRQQVRAGDLAARLGGDEFALFFPTMSEEAARRRGEALLSAVQGLQEHAAHKRKPLGLSVGVAVMDTLDRREDAETLLARADAAMYRIKKGTKAGLAFAEPLEAKPAS